MGTEALAAWLLSIMLSAVPPGKSRFPAAARESSEAGTARYAAIARAIAEVSLDPEEAPVLDDLPKCSHQDLRCRARVRSAALLLAIALHESHWRRDVDLGLGRRGRYHCMMQIAVDRGKTPEGWTAEQLVQSRELCFRRALHILQRGKRQCGSRDFRFVNHYASGYCGRGRKAVAKRIDTFERWMKEHPFPDPERAAKRRRAGAPEAAREPKAQ